MSTYLYRLKSKISELQVLKDKFISSCDIHYHNPNNEYSGIIHIGATLLHWGQPKEGHEICQLEIRKKFAEFIEYFSLLTPLLPEKTTQKDKKATIQITSWIEKKRNAPGCDVPSAISNFNKELAKFSSTIDLLQSITNKGEKIIVPDTNALICHPEISDYSNVFKENILIYIPSTVISELDKLKVYNKNEDVRNKAKSIITRLKGYRKQGDIISEGIVLAKTLILKLIPTEPKFENTLSWLDSNNMDDRIIVTMLEIELTNLSSEVILITGDLNLQNKAELAGIKYLDVDEILNNSIRDMAFN